MWKNILSLFVKQSKRKIHQPVSKKSFFENIGTSVFQKRKKKRFFQKKIKFHVFFSKRYWLIIILWIGISIGVIALILIFGPFLKVSHIFISRQDTVTNIDQAYTSVDYIRGKNILFLDTADLVARLQKGQNSIANIEFQIDFPNTLNLSLKSYPPLFQTEAYIILSNGTLLQKENQGVYDVPYITLITDNPDAFLFGNNLNVEELKNIHLLSEQLEKSIPEFRPVVLQYFIQEKELILSNTQGTLFIFDLQGEREKQIAQLSIFQKERSDLLNKKYIYIDVRIDQKLFLCGYEEEYSCRKNLINIYGPDIFTNLEKASSLSQLGVSLEDDLQNTDDQRDVK